MLSRVSVLQAHVRKSSSGIIFMSVRGISIRGNREQR